jgi:hypothetical protein
MRTRSECAAIGYTAVPDLPEGVQLVLASHLAEQFALPDDHEYALYPYKTSFCWLATLARVSSSWRSHLLEDPHYIRRSRLEALRRISLWHDYVHVIKGSTPKSKRQKRLPSTVTLHFPQSPAVPCSVQKQLTAAETKGLPADCLIIAIEACKVTPLVLQQLLCDQVLLDARHTTHFVWKIAKHKSCPSCNSPYCPQHHTQPNSQGQEQQQQQHCGHSAIGCEHGLQLPTEQLPPPAANPEPSPGEEGASAVAVPGPSAQAVAGASEATASSRSSSSRLEVLTQAYHELHQNPRLYLDTLGEQSAAAALKALVLERGEGGQALYFIPTHVGFRRRNQH